MAKKKNKPYVIVGIVFLVLIAIVICSTWFSSLTENTDNSTNSTNTNSTINRTVTNPRPINNTQQPRPIDISTGPSSGGSSGGSSSSGGNSNGGSTSAQQLALTREFDEEDQSITTGSNQNNVYQFRVITADRLTFNEVSFNLVFENNIDDATMYALRNTRVELQKLTQGSWQTLTSTTFSDYTRGNYNFNLRSSSDISVEGGDQFRLVMSNFPCEENLATNFVSFSMLNGNRPSINLATTRTIEFEEEPREIPILECNLNSRPSNPSLWLRFEEAAGTFFDSSGKQNHVINPRGIEYHAEGRADYWSAYFKGGNTDVKIPASDSLDFSDPITIQMFIHPKKGNNWQGLIGKGNGVNNYDWLVAMTPNNKIGFYSEKTGWYETSGSIGIGDWEHITVTLGNCNIGPNGEHTGCDLKIYHNGFEQTVTGLNGAPLDPLNVDLGIPMGRYTIAIGSWPENRIYPFEGFIDNVIISPRVLTPLEVETHYNSFGAV